MSDELADSIVRAAHRLHKEEAGKQFALLTLHQSGSRTYYEVVTEGARKRYDSEKPETGYVMALNWLFRNHYKTREPELDEIHSQMHGALEGGRSGRGLVSFRQVAVFSRTVPLAEREDDFEP